MSVERRPSTSLNCKVVSQNFAHLKKILKSLKAALIIILYVQSFSLSSIMNPITVLRFESSNV